MTTTALVVVLIGLALLVGTLSMRGDAATNKTPATRDPRAGRDDAPIDPGDDYLVDQLIKMSGGAATDAGVARAALGRFHAEHGRPATPGDLGAILALMRAA